jgi:acyl-CoA reductase-like NAD-dependent aldehyde dehydrogenase
MLACYNPATGEAFDYVRVTTPQQARQAVAELRAAQPALQAAPLGERIRLLRQLQSALLDMRDEVTATITRDCGKSRQDSLIELFVVVDNIAAVCRNAPRWLRRKRVSSGLYFFKRTWLEPRPYGVVAVIAPWNYPLLLTLQPLAAALVTGNTVAVKPSEVTAATGTLVERLLACVPGLAPYVRVLHGDGRVGAALLSAPPDYVYFTGSTRVGSIVQRLAAEHLVPMTAELGGKDPMLVLEDADLEAAAEWGTWGAMFNAGQTCMAVERVYVVEPVYDEFVARVVAAAGRQQVGYSPDLQAELHLGPLIYERQLQVVRQHIADAVQGGARVLVGGNSRGLFFEPTVLVDVNHAMLIMREETFGPVMPIMKVRDANEAVRLANDSRYGLSASIWTRNMARARDLASKIQTGSVVVNDTISHFVIPSVPFGGVKHSGFGRAHGESGMLQFTQPHAYVAGSPPHPLDIATIMRRPGRYAFGSVTLHLLFGGSLRQRLQPLAEYLASRRGGGQLAGGIRAALNKLRAVILGLIGTIRQG